MTKIIISCSPSFNNTTDTDTVNTFTTIKTYTVSSTNNGNNDMLLVIMRAIKL